ncbi:Uncharacterized protein BP5553_01453 [Venustampulla echinocandica]|uniref:F-box domain-containing protein n=1 Tax=Venustampulla echinocandica TaxID=2656787 RepID=A0A370U128_9HELO|nr:Uncharacterized protein BP5553_01453 [Venustampulla echinocandica]RDL41474.1 Uncharacterized protein BP5553_01453 [Venustampulla echinocandica]
MIPDKGMPSNAQKTVLSTPDLLISILSQLPHSSLLKAKLVNKTWASLFKHVEIKAALFERPRPKGSALYTETYSDVLMNKFSTFWPINGEASDRVGIPESNVEKKLRSKESNEMPVDVPKIYDPSEIHLQETMALQPRPHGHIDKCRNWQWRQLLVCQPAVEVLEIVQYVNRRVGCDLEFRTIIPRSNGLRMGFLYDAVRHWFKVERSFEVNLLWNRKTGDLINNFDTYEGGPSYKTAEDKPCVTIWGMTSVGCGQWGGVTFEKYCGGSGVDPRAQVIKSGDEEVEYSMSEPKVHGVDDGLLSDYLEEFWHARSLRVLKIWEQQASGEMTSRHTEQPVSAGPEGTSPNVPLFVSPLPSAGSVSCGNCVEST